MSEREDEELQMLIADSESELALLLAEEEDEERGDG